MRKMDLLLTEPCGVYVRQFALLISMLILGAAIGCTTDREDSFAFLGIPETESSDQGPVGLIQGQPCKIKNVSAVTETTFSDYETAKRAGEVFAEEPHGAWVYYAIKKQRDVRFDNATALLDVIERFKARKP